MIPAIDRGDRGGTAFDGPQKYLAINAARRGIAPAEKRLVDERGLRRLVATDQHLQAFCFGRSQASDLVLPSTVGVSGFGLARGLGDEEDRGE